ncbi:hypothetical protein REPUB_Repub18cG0077000 [Reevesia pubescens]
MASFKHQPVKLKFTVSVLLIFFLTVSPSKSGKIQLTRADHILLQDSVVLLISVTFIPGSFLAVGSVSITDNDSSKAVKMVLGSRPPKCVNRCFSCRPCMAALVASPHHRTGRSSSYKGDESYYLLAWKCKCGDKFFEP